MKEYEDFEKSSDKFFSFLKKWFDSKGFKSDHDELNFVSLLLEVLGATIDCDV